MQFHAAHVRSIPDALTGILLLVLAGAAGRVTMVGLEVLDKAFVPVRSTVATDVLDNAFTTFAPARLFATEEISVMRVAAMATLVVAALKTFEHPFAFLRGHTVKEMW